MNSIKPNLHIILLYISSLIPAILIVPLIPFLWFLSYDDAYYLELVRIQPNIQYLVQRDFLWENRFRPMFWAFKLITTQFFGLNPTIYHLLNLIIFLVTLFLLTKFLYQKAQLPFIIALLTLIIIFYNPSYISGWIETIPQEALANLFLALSLFLINKKNMWISLVLMSLTKENYIFLIPSILLLKYQKRPIFLGLISIASIIPFLFHININQAKIFFTSTLALGFTTYLFELTLFIIIIETLIHKKFPIKTLPFLLSIFLVFATQTAVYGNVSYFTNHHSSPTIILVTINFFIIYNQFIKNKIISICTAGLILIFFFLQCYKFSVSSVFSNYLASSTFKKIVTSSSYNDLPIIISSYPKSYSTQIISAKRFINQFNSKASIYFLPTINNCTDNNVPDTSKYALNEFNPSFTINDLSTFPNANVITINDCDYQQIIKQVDSKHKITEIDLSVKIPFKNMLDTFKIPINNYPGFKLVSIEKQ